MSDIDVRKYWCNKNTRLWKMVYVICLQRNTFNMLFDTYHTEEDDFKFSGSICTLEVRSCSFKLGLNLHGHRSTQPSKVVKPLCVNYSAIFSVLYKW